MLGLVVKLGVHVGLLRSIHSGSRVVAICCAGILVSHTFELL